MKRFCIISLVLILASCSSSKYIDLGNQASSEGVKVCAKAMDFYDLMLNQRDIDKAQQEKIEILTNPQPDSMKLPDIKVTDFSTEIAVRKKAYRNLSDTYKAFGLLSDQQFGDKTKEATAALQESYNSIEKLPDIPSSVSSLLPGVSKMITQAFQAKDIKKHNLIMYNISQVYLALWIADEPLWEQYINRIYNDYASGLCTVDSKKYDFQKIQANISEPFNDESVLLLLYRLDQKNEIYKQRDSINEQLKYIEKALASLNAIHSEIAKEKSDVSDATSLINSFDNLLNQK